MIDIKIEGTCPQKGDPGYEQEFARRCKIARAQFNDLWWKEMKRLIGTTIMRPARPYEGRVAANRRRGREFRARQKQLKELE